MRNLALLLLAVSFPAFADDLPYLVRDLPGLTVHDSSPVFWTNAGSTTWFAATTAAGSTEVFATDGTAAGTVQMTHGTGAPVARWPGAFLGSINGKLVYGGRDAGGEGVFALDTNGGAPLLLGRFQLATLTNGVVRGDALFFTGRTPAGEHELWRTNGTAEGTAKIDLLPGAAGAFDISSQPRLFAAGASIFFFGATAQGPGLHRTDGTSTTLLVPLTESGLLNDVGGAFVFGDRLLFTLRRTELWVTDGTAAGTSKIAAVDDFRPFGVLGGTLFFDGGNAVWTTDGTAAGTRRTDLFAGSFLENGYVAGNRLFFTGNSFENGQWSTRLYASDGGAAPAHAITAVDLHSSFALGEGFAIGGFYYFRTDDGVHGMELWRTDGTTAQMVVDINPSYRDGLEILTGFTRPDGKVLFVAKQFDTGVEPWITDGTAAGTHLLKDVAEEETLSGSSPTLLRASGGRLFFIAQLTGGEAVGTSDGTSAGTSASLLDLRWAIYDAAVANGRYFFESVYALYASDGTAGGTTPIFQASAKPYALNDGILFTAGGDLWFSDGTLGGTRRVSAFTTTPRIVAGGALAWLTSGARLWTTDGSTVTEIVPSPAPTSEIYGLLRAGARTYFIESNNPLSHGLRLWRSDGTAAGTAVVKDLGLPNTPAEFVGATPAGTVYVRFNDKLVRSDGTDAGTLTLPADSPCVASGAVLGGAFLFTSLSPGGTLTLWRTDGTAAGTTSLYSSRPQNVNSGCPTLTARGNAVYFSGWDAAHGWELWTSDGTSAGTKMLADIYPGTKSSFPSELTLAGDRLFFSADSPNIGRELWAVGGLDTPRRRAARP